MFLKLKILKFIKKSTSGRNNKGHLTSERKGGGIKKFHWLIDYKRNFFNSPAKVLNIFEHINRSFKVCLVLYKNGYLSFIPYIQGLNIKDIVISLKNTIVKYNYGDFLSLKYFSIGSLVSNIEGFYLNGSKYVRSGGLSAKVLKQTKVYTLLMLPSMELRFFFNECRAICGIIEGKKKRIFYKAGEKRLLGIRPKVRGIARNPVDHPNGGRTNGGKIFKDR